jgi:formylglycine-generating enzyme required for sulfatase activity
MFFVAIERRTAIRMAAMIAVTAAAYSLTLVALELTSVSAQPGFIPTPPRGASDPGNRAVFIHGGTFATGNSEPDPDVNPASPFSTADESVRHVTLLGFWMQEHEVTNEEYRRFDPGHEFPAGMEHHPVVDVTWLEALAYAESLGGSLPTESQWEFAARGTNSRRYPWGDAEPTCERAHYAGCEPRSTIAVMSRAYGATPEGIHGLAGNVWEWVMPDWFDPERTPVNRASRRQRGGSFAEPAFFLRAANRNNDFYAGYRSDSVGFRVVWPVD